MNTQNVTPINTAPLSSDFTVDQDTGEAFISQRKLAELLDIPRKTLTDRIRTAHRETDISRGIPGEIANQTAHHYARSGRSGAIEFICKISEAGMKAYIYDQAGFKMKAEKVAPQTLLEALKLAVEQQEQLQRLTGENQNLHTAIDNIFGYASILRASQHVGVHESEFSWRILKPKAISLNLPPKKVPSPRYKYQLLYPIQAFVECYPQHDYAGIIPHDFTDTPEI